MKKLQVSVFLEEDDEDQEDPSERITLLLNVDVIKLEEVNNITHGGSGKEKPRLTELRNGDRLLTLDLLSLWQTFLGAEGYVGVLPTMTSFGAWLAGNSINSSCFLNEEPAEVVW